MMRSLGLLVAVLLLDLTPLLASRGCQASEQPATEAKYEGPVDKELRTLTEELVKAINSQDFDKLLPLLDARVVATFLDGECAHQPKGVKAYYEKMMTGETRTVKKVTIEPTVDGRSQLYGNPTDTAITAGSSNDSYELTDGRNFTVKTRWTATMVKKDGKWKLTSFHASTSPSDNSILTCWVAGIAAGAGLFLGVLLTLVFRRRPARNAFMATALGA